MSNRKSLQESIDSVQTNRFGGYYQSGTSYSPSRLAECVDSYHVFARSHGREPTVREFMETAKIGGKDLSCKIIHSIKYGIEMRYLERGHRHEGTFSMTDRSLEIQLELYHLYLDWPSRPIRSYKKELLKKLNVSASTGSMSH